MALTIREAANESDFRQFVQLPFDLYKNNKYWVPALKADEMAMLRPVSNPYSAFCDSCFWLAYQDGKCVGRIGAIINKRYNEKIGEQFARFTRIEFIDDASVADLLIQTAENWAKTHNMTGVMGPLGFSNLDMQGLLIEGFDFLPSIASTYHFPYYQAHVERNGYIKESDWLEFRLTIGEAAVEKANRGAQLIKKRYGIEIVDFTRSEDLAKYADTIFSILNDSFSDLPFVTPFTADLTRYYTKKYMRLLNPEFVKIVTVQKEPVGFIVGMPSLSEAMQKARGKMFPLGFYYLLRARKGKDTMDQLLTGVKKQHQSTGAAVVLMAALQNAMLQKGMKYIETTGIFETNQSAIGNWKNYEHIQHKRRRCYRKIF